MKRIFLSLALSLFACASFAAGSAEENMPNGFIDAASVIQDATYDIRYFSADNFVGRRIEGYDAPKCILTKEAASALASAAGKLRTFGLKFRIFDCYRPQRAVDDFARWASDIKDTKTKAKHYPRVEKKDLFKEGYIAERSGHTRGSTLDVTIDGLELGTMFDLFDERAHTEYPMITEQERANRLLLKTIMEECGFEGYDKEWWHFKLKDEPYQDKYFNFPIR